MENIIARLRAEYQHKKDKRGWLKANKDIKINAMDYCNGPPTAGNSPAIHRGVEQR